MAVHGVSIQNHAIPEGSLGAIGAPTSANYVGLESLELKPNREYVDIMEFQRTHEKLGWIPGKISGEFSGNFQMKLPTGLGVVPEHDVIYAQALGQNVNNPAARINAGVSVTYIGNPFTAAPDSIKFVQVGGGQTAPNRLEYFLHQANGCVIKKISWKIDGGQPCMCEFEGEFRDYGYLFGAPLLDDPMAADATGTLVAGGYRFIRPGNAGIYVTIGADDNTGAGHRLTEINRATEVFTLVGSTATASAGNAIIPFIPAITTAGAHLDGVTNNLNLNDGAISVNHGIISANITCETGMLLLNKEANSALAHRIGQTKRKWSGEVTFYAENEMAYIQAETFQGTEYAAEFRFGGTAAGSRYRLTLPAIRFNTMDSITFEDEDEGTEVTASFDARRTSGENTGSLIAD